MGNSVGVFVLRYVSMCMDGCLTRRCQTEKSAGDSTIIPTYVCDLSTSKSSDCNTTFRRIAILMCLCAWIWNHSSCPTGLAYDDCTHNVWCQAGKSVLLLPRITNYHKKPSTHWHIYDTFIDYNGGSSFKGETCHSFRLV